MLNGNNPTYEKIHRQPEGQIALTFERDGLVSLLLATGWILDCFHYHFAENFQKWARRKKKKLLEVSQCYRKLSSTTYVIRQKLFISYRYHASYHIISYTIYHILYHRP